MEWIFEHLQILVFIGVGIAYWIKQSSKASSSAGQDRETRGPDRHYAPPPVADDPDARVREIQAEIRRKIAERRAAAQGRQERPADPALETPPPVPQVRTVAPPPPLPEPVRAGQNAEDSEGDFAGGLKLQQRLADQLAEAERARVESRRKLAEVWQTPAVAAAAAAPARRDAPSTVRGTLRDRAALRRAWVLREVLDKPVGLR